MRTVKSAGLIVLCCSCWGLLRGAAAAVGSEHEAVTSSRLKELKAQTKELWYHGWTSYMRHAFPADELRPLSCLPRYPDLTGTGNYGVNDVVGNYSLTLVDNLDTFAILGDRAGFEEAVRNTIKHVSFDQDHKVQVFEITIRALGGLLSGHLLARDRERGFHLEWYQDELLLMALDLGQRLLPAFKATTTGIPIARINLRRGVQQGESFETCTAGAGSLILEFGLLSRLTGRDEFENVAKNALAQLWARRSSSSLMGNSINAETGQWIDPAAGIGAGIDSFYEYMLKAAVLFPNSRTKVTANASRPEEYSYVEDDYLGIFNQAYEALEQHSLDSTGYWWRTVNAQHGGLVNVFVDSLSAFWPGLQVMMGDIEGAVRSHLLYYNLWNKYGIMPEMFNMQTKQVHSGAYPLRPEFVESTYHLYQATQDPFYLRVGEKILSDIGKNHRVDCGLATISNVFRGEMEDRMESFALSETLKYLYLLFDVDNPFNKDHIGMVFTTEGHPIWIPKEHKSATVIRSPSAFLKEARQSPRWTRRHPLINSIPLRTDFHFVQYLTNTGYPDKEPSPLLNDGFCDALKERQAASTGREVVLQFAGEGEGPLEGKVYGNSILFTKFGNVSIRLRSRLDGTGWHITQFEKSHITIDTVVVISEPALPQRWNSPPVFDVSQSDLVVLQYGFVNPPYQHASHASTATFTRLDRLNYHGSMMGAKRLYQPDHELQGCEVWNEAQAAEMKDKIVVLSRGGCTFTRKLKSALQVESAGVIVINDDNQLFRPTSGRIEAGEETDPDIIEIVQNFPQQVVNGSIMTPLFLTSWETGQILQERLLKPKENESDSVVGFVQLAPRLVSREMRPFDKEPLLGPLANLIGKRYALYYDNQPIMNTIAVV